MVVGLFIILTNNPVHSILALVLVFLLSSCLSLVLGVEFMAILILIVYVGAISVLFLFVVMLLNIRVLELNVSLVKYWWLGVLYTFFFLFYLIYAIWPLFFFNKRGDVVFLNFLNQTSEWDMISQFGELIYIYYPHLLLIAALILFVAIVSPVLLTFVSFTRSSEFIGSSLVSEKTQEIFKQTIRLSVEKNFK